MIFCGAVADAGIVLIDPAFDTCGVSGEPQCDLATASTDLTASPGDIIFQVTFHAPPMIALPSERTADSIDIRIDIDVDQNPLTGGSSNLDILGQGVPGPGLGVDFYLEQSSDELLNPGMAVMFDETFTQVGSLLPVTLTSSSFSVTIPLAALGLTTGQEINFGVIAGPFGGSSATDQVTFPPNAVVPEPAGVVPVLLGLGLVIGRRHTHRR